MDKVGRSGKWSTRTQCHLRRQLSARDWRLPKQDVRKMFDRERASEMHQSNATTEQVRILPRVAPSPHRLLQGVALTLCTLSNNLITFLRAQKSCRFYFCKLFQVKWLCSIYL